MIYLGKSKVYLKQPLRRLVIYGAPCDRPSRRIGCHELDALHKGFFRSLLQAPGQFFTRVCVGRFATPVDRPSRRPGEVKRTTYWHRLLQELQIVKGCEID